jgi:triosephosphate isomerase (TIM)
MSAPAPGRRPLVSGNWKMHHDHVEALHLTRDLGLRLRRGETEPVEVSIHPPFSDLRTVQTQLEAEHMAVALGAQHCFDQDRGAYTGEISPQMLARLGVRYVLVGHSERRRLFGMTDEQVAGTLRAVLRHQMTPVLCVGETEEEHDSERTEERLAEQLAAALFGLLPEQVGALVVAYEPIWAIGSGRPATADDAATAASFIRGQVAQLAGDEAAQALRVQYGGSVTSENAPELVASTEVDGLLVGGASLKAAEFSDIVRGVAGCYRSLAG